MKKILQNYYLLMKKILITQKITKKYKKIKFEKYQI